MKRSRPPICSHLQTPLKRIKEPPPKNDMKRKQEEERRVENGNDKFLLNQV